RQVVTFAGLEPVVDATVNTNFTVNGNNANNSISYIQGSSVNNGLVAIDAFETVEFTNKDNLIINASGGDDTINLDNPSRPVGSTLGGLKTITVNGGEPTASDKLIVNGVPGLLDNLRVLPTNNNAGTVVNDSAAQPDVLYTGIEHVLLVGQQHDS